MGTSFTLLKNEALIFLEGDDTHSFLQGQSTCDVRLLSQNLSLQGLFCTPKGRVLSDFLLLDFENSRVALRLKKEIEEVTKLNLKKYAAFSQVKFIEELTDWQVAGCWGKDAKDVIQKLMKKDINGKGGKIRTGDFHVIQIDEQGEHFECIFSSKTSSELLKNFLEICHDSDETGWEQEIIKLGTSRLDLTSSEEHVPQVLNYDLNGFISFEKGCYTGQEIVARLKYRGRPKRRCFFATSEEREVMIVPGSNVYFADTDNIAGVIINVASTSQAITILISISEKALNAELRASNPTGPKLTLGRLPYEVVF